MNESNRYNVEWKIARYKREHSVLFLLFEDQKGARLIYSDGGQKRACFWWGTLTSRGHEAFSGVLEI